MGNYHARCGAGEKPEVETPEAYLSLFGEVPDFPSRLATMRKYNISATIALQNISQIEAMYENDWKTLVGNCSTVVFLGSQEPEVLKYFSEMLGNATIRVRSEGTTTGTKSGSSQNYQATKREVMSAEELGRLPSDECIVYTQNMRAVRDKKYVYENHPYYPQTADKDEAFGFRYQNMSVYNNTRAGHIESMLKARSEAARLRKREEEKRIPKDPSAMKADANAADALNNVRLPEEAERRIERMFTEEAVLQGAAQRDASPCFILLKGIPTKYLVPIARQVSTRLKRPAVVIFSDTAEKDSDAIVGVGIDQDREGLVTAMENDLAVKTGMREGITYSLIVKKDYEAFKKQVQDAFMAAKTA